MANPQRDVAAPTLPLHSVNDDASSVASRAASCELTMMVLADADATQGQNDHAADTKLAGAAAAGGAILAAIMHPDVSRAAFTSAEATYRGGRRGAQVCRAR